jgi:hypothetical protein
MNVVDAAEANALAVASITLRIKFFSVFIGLSP